MLACPRGMRVLPTGGSADLARLAREANFDLYELPHGRTGAVESALEMQGYTSGAHARWLVGLDGARVRFEKGESGERNESAESIAVFDWWDAFDDLVTLRSGADGAILWEEVEGWLGKQSESSEPRRALIVEIAESLSASIGHRARHLRRILLRRRDLVPVHSIKQLDEECLRWYIRQPGETLAEKAGHKQEIMSVVRQETFDTLENRILKDFLRRSIHAGSRYVRRFQDEYPNSKRILGVQKYVRTCEEALTLPEFDAVQRPRPGALPNYVLQSDARYRDIWTWYQKLLRNQDSEEQIWNWQGRLWADVCRLLVGATCHFLIAGSRASARDALTRAPLFVEREGRLGSRLGDSWGPGPLLARRTAGSERVLSIVDSSQTDDHAITPQLSQLGAHCYLIEEGLGGGGKFDALAIWALNGMATTQEFDSVEIVRSATRALVRVSEQLSSSHMIGRLDGMILVSESGYTSHTYSGLDARAEGDSRACVIGVGSEPRSWDDAVVEIATQMEEWL